MSTPLAPEIEITKDVGLTDEMASMMDMHSFLNVLNVLVGELSLISLAAENPETLSKTNSLAFEIKTLLGAADKRRRMGEQLLAIERHFEAELAELLADKPDLAGDPEINESVSNIRSVIQVLKTRVAEYMKRLDHPETWERHSIAKLTDNFRNFFAAVEKNSKGRYRIIYNIAAQDQSDYVVNLSIQSVDGDSINIPPFFRTSSAISSQMRASTLRQAGLSMPA